MFNSSWICHTNHIDSIFKPTCSLYSIEPESLFAKIRNVYDLEGNDAHVHLKTPKYFGSFMEMLSLKQKIKSFSQTESNLETSRIKFWPEKKGLLKGFSDSNRRLYRLQRLTRVAFVRSLLYRCFLKASIYLYLFSSQVAIYDGFKRRMKFLLRILMISK